MKSLANSEGETEEKSSTEKKPAIFLDVHHVPWIVRHLGQWRQFDSFDAALAYADSFIRYRQLIKHIHPEVRTIVIVPIEVLKVTYVFDDVA